jgi:hypothetical protein
MTTNLVLLLTVPTGLGLGTTKSVSAVPARHWHGHANPLEWQRHRQDLVIGCASKEDPTVLDALDPEPVGPLAAVRGPDLDHRALGHLLLGWDGHAYPHDRAGRDDRPGLIHS